MAETEPASADSNDRYVVVARRYRPKNFGELIGQGHVGQALKNAIETNRVGHAYLFTGARGVGKTSTARIFAKALNAPAGMTADPDDDSDIARSIDAGEDIDVIEIDGASNRGIDEIRSLRAAANVRPSRARFKIYIIDEVHMLTKEAFNALLKTLEEPPEHVKFIFCTTDPDKVPITVRSRCQRFDFAPVQTDAIEQRLAEICSAEGVEAESAALQLIARRAAGSMRDSQSLLEQVLSFSRGALTAQQVHRLLGTANDERIEQLLQALMQRDARAALEKADVAIADGVDPGQLCEQLLGYLRDILVVAVGCDASILQFCSDSMAETLKGYAETWGVPTILAVVGLLDQMLDRASRSMHGRILMEAALIQICHLPDLQRIADLAAGLPNASPGKGGSEKKNAPPQLTAAAEPDWKPADRPAPLVAIDGGSAPATAPPPHHQDPAERQAEPVAATAIAAPPSTAARDAPRVSQTESEKELPSQGASAEARSNEVQWNAEGAAKLWRSAAQQLDDLTANEARQASRIECLEPGRLRILFPKSLKLTKSRCEKPEQKSKIEACLTASAARDVRIEFGFDPDAVALTPPAAPPPSTTQRRQKQRELRTHPLVQKCMEIFDAELIKVDAPAAPPQDSPGAD